MRFMKRVIATPEGRAHLLNQLADAEGNGENGFFEHVLAHVDDPGLQQDDHASTGTTSCATSRCSSPRATRTGIDRRPVPTAAQVRSIGSTRAGRRFFAQPIRDRRDIMEAYLMLQVIEERSVTQFALFERAFRRRRRRDRGAIRRDRRATKSGT